MLFMSLSVRDSLKGKQFSKTIWSSMDYVQMAWTPTPALYLQTPSHHKLSKPMIIFNLIFLQVLPWLSIRLAHRYQSMFLIPDHSLPQNPSPPSPFWLGAYPPQSRPGSVPPHHTCWDCGESGREDPRGQRGPYDNKSDDSHDIVKFRYFWRHFWTCTDKLTHCQKVAWEKGRQGQSHFCNDMP